MSALCPQCGHSLEQDFGVVSCSHCQSVLVIDLDGSIQIQDPGQMGQEIHDAVQEEEILTEIYQPEETVIEQIHEPAFELPIEPQPLEEQSLDNSVVTLNNTSSSIINYQVTIQGIDTKEVREQLEDAMKDPKFPWNAREITQQIQNGILELGPLNPVAASVLVRKLKDLPLTISWRQKIYE